MKLLEYVCKMLSYFYFEKMFKGINYLFRCIRNNFYQRKLNAAGEFSIDKPFVIRGQDRIQIGKNFRVDRGLILIAWDKFNNMKYDSHIQIGDNFDAGFDLHIGAVNEIIIGNNVLIGSKVYITDHFHGHIIPEEVNISPIRRVLYSKSSVKIKDNVWIGDNVVIMPGVEIGEGCIIGANAVVTKSIPDRVVVAGVPARIIKRFDEGM